MSKDSLREPDDSATTADPDPPTKFDSISFPLWAKIVLAVIAIVVLALGLGLGIGLGLKHHNSSKNSTSTINATAVAAYWGSIWSYGGSPAVYPSGTSLETSTPVPLLHKLTTTQPTLLVSKIGPMLTSMQQRSLQT
jgi:hypothetical protein